MTKEKSISIYTRSVIIFILLFFQVFFFIDSIWAAEVEFSGQAQIKYKWQDFQNTLPSDFGRQTTFLLDSSWQPNSNTSFFLRYGKRDYNGDYTTTRQARIDKYGLSFRQGQAKMTLGVKESYLGAVGGLLDLGDNVGRGLFSGAELAINHKHGQWLLQTGKLDGFLFSDNRDRSMTALQTSGKIIKADWSLTALNLTDLDKADHYADLSFSHSAGKASYMAEFVRSSAPSDPWAIFLGTQYKPDENHAVILVIGRTGENSIPQGNGTLGAYESGLRGMQLQLFSRLGPGQTVLTLSKAYSFTNKINITKTELEYKVYF